VVALGVTDQHSQLQLYSEGPFNKLVTFLLVENPGGAVPIPSQPKQIEGISYLGGHSLEELMKIEAQATQIALVRAGRSNMSFILPEINPFTISQLLFLLEVQTVFTGGLYDINPMDQPGVEASKHYIYGMMGRSGFEDKAEEAKEWQTFIDLEAAMRYFLRGGGDWHELIKRGLQAAEASERIGDKAAYAWSALISLSWTYRKRGDFAEALRWAEEAHESFEKLGDKRGIAASLRNLGSIAESQEKLDEAKDFYQQCIAVLGESADREAGYDAYVDLGDIARKQENYDEAHQFYDDRLRVWQELGDPLWTTILLGKLGLVAYARGDYETAWRLFKDGLRGNQNLGNQIGIAYDKWALAHAGMLLGKDRTQMQALAQEALEIFERLGMKREHEEVRELTARLGHPLTDD